MRSLGLMLAVVVLPASLLVGTPSQAAPAPAASAAAQPTKPLPVPAEAALRKVERIFAGKPGSGPVRRHDRPDATMALRDLALAKDELPRADRKRAEGYLARPTDDSAGDGPPGAPKYARPEAAPLCSEQACVHYVASTQHAATATFANHVLTAIGTTHQKYLDMGYRAPVSDLAAANNGGSHLPDIYLADIGDRYFGYCVPEGWANQTDDNDYSVYAFCVLDNDYSPDQFGNSQPPLDFMRVTAAHEFFHLVQFGYDAGEDPWFMEATATWAEDEVFDNINDNVAFLWGDMSVMTNPRMSMDRFPGNSYSYWLFFSYLSQKYGADIIRAMWERADTVGSAPHHYSLQAVRSAVKAAGGSWNDLWRGFADANRRPKRAYGEARRGEAAYPSSALRANFTMTASRRTRDPGVSLDHLTSTVYRFTPSRDMRWGWKLRVKIDGNTPRQGGAGLATIRRQDGTYKRVAFDLDSNGVRTKTFIFGRGPVSWIEITVVNASTRMANCNTDTAAPYYSCAGTPRDDNRTTRVWATAVKS